MDIEKTKIVCTIGPAASSKRLIRRFVGTGLKVRRLSTTAEIFSASEKAAAVSGLLGRNNNRIVAVCGDPSSPCRTTDLLRLQTVTKEKS